MNPPASGPKYAPVRFRLIALLLVFSLLALAIPTRFIQIIQTAEAASTTVVVSQVYGGGGNAGATYKNDFIELFNRGTTTVSLAGWSVQYASSAGTSWSVTNLSGSIAPGKYYLVQESAGTGGTVSLPTPDATGTIAMSATAGKVALVNSTVALNTACPAVVDFVGFGGANCFEGSAPTATLSNTTAALRAGNGCNDTDQNGSDFSAGAPTPRNSSTPATTCGNSAPTITAPPNPAATATQPVSSVNVSLSGSDDNSVYNWSATPGAGVSAVTVASGQGTNSVTYTVTIQSGFTGTAKFTASLSDNVNTATTQLVNITVNPAVVVNNPPTITAPANPITSTTRDSAPFNVTLQGSDDGSVYNWSAAAGTGVSSVVVGGGQGTSNVTYTVTLASGFTGTATFAASLSDNVNAPATQAVNINVTAPPPLDHVVISQVYGGGGNSGATYQNDYVELFNPTAVPVDVTGWSVQYGSATGSTWQTQPIGGPIQPGEYYLISLASGGAVGASLPAANIIGEINMSGTAGKVALASSGSALSGACPTANVVDLVGYGTANCREGATNAPSLGGNAALALFRKAGGFTDTNVNGSDFQTGAPNPRRTAVITELGPWVSSTDPRSNGFDIPHDKTIEVGFSEPVDAVGAWFDITCTGTGSHNDGTTSHSNDYKTWAFTPNSNFQYGEQCTFTVSKDAIHDRDTDDGGPNTDMLFANYVSSFTVLPQSSAAPAPYPPGVHLTMGNPSNATADVNQPNNYLMEKDAYALSYNRDKGTPNWVSWHLEPAWYGNLARADTFRADPAVPADWYRVQSFDYGFSGFDRGHMTPNADRDNPTEVQLNQATFLMSNMVPQAPDNNQGPWADMENALRTIADGADKTSSADDNELYIVSGPAGVGGTGSSGFATNIVNGHVTVPAYTWKVVLVLPKQDGDDISRVTCATQTIAVKMPNVQGIRDDDWHKYITTVDDIEALTGYNFFSNVPEVVQQCIEAGTNGTNPPGTIDGAYTTAEDTPADVTMTAASPGGTLTYTVVTGPSHGTLTGSGATRQYTPAPDFHGTDSFTFRVNDGTHDSNTSTVSLLVTEVNDSPTAADDGGKTTQEDTALSFPAGELTSNDSAGPADESGQTLTVSSVAAGADTHGTVALAAGQVTYTPAADYNGPASFTYQVCDDGNTAGNADPKCATATVNVTVESVNDNPTASDDSATTNEDTAVNVNVVGNDTDLDGDTLSVTAVTQPAHGSVANNGGSVSYTPNPNYNGGDTFNYTVSDGHGGTATATVTVNVTAVNDNPTATNDTATTDEDTPVSVNVVFNDSDIDGDALTLESADGATHGSVAVVSGRAVFTPEANYHGPASFNYVVSDGNGGTANGSVSVTVNSVNDNPVAVADSATTNEDTPVTVHVLTNDTDVDGDTLSVTSAGGASKGSVAVVAFGVTYTPNANANGSDSFTYNVSDGNGGTASATVTVTINAVNDAPSSPNVPAPATIAELAAYTFTASATDVDGDTLTFSLVGAPAGATINPSTGEFNWTPSEAQGGTGAPFNFAVRVSDGTVSADSNVSITVTEVNSAPTLAPIANQVVLLGGTLTFNASATDGDLPAQTLAYSLTGAFPAGATINPATGAFSWTPTAAQAGHVYTFGVRVADNGPGQLSAEQPVTVSAGYTWSGFLQPINQDGNSVFKAGQAVSIKFQLTGASAGITNAVVRLYVAKISDNVAGTEEEADSTSNATEGNLFRYADGQYIFNLSTKGLTLGTYQLRVDTGDGVLRVVNISLR